MDKEIFPEYIKTFIKKLIKMGNYNVSDVFTDYKEEKTLLATIIIKSKKFEIYKGIEYYLVEINGKTILNDDLDLLIEELKNIVNNEPGNESKETYTRDELCWIVIEQIDIYNRFNSMDFADKNKYYLTAVILPYTHSSNIQVPLYYYEGYYIVDVDKHVGFSKNLFMHKDFKECLKLYKERK